MRTPEEIKEGLEHCVLRRAGVVDCNGCPYKPNIPCGSMMHKDALAYIEQLEECEWELFDLLSSIWFTKACYFKQEDGTVYSRASSEYMTFDQAIDEFAGELTCETQLEPQRVKLLQKIKQLEAQVPKWISVEERLPEKKERVLFFAEEPRLTMDTAYGWWVNTTNRYKITHWMPIPEPPKE